MAQTWLESSTDLKSSIARLGAFPEGSGSVTLQDGAVFRHSCTTRNRVRLSVSCPLMQPHHWKNHSILQEGAVTAVHQIIEYILHYQVITSYNWVTADLHQLCCLRRSKVSKEEGLGENSMKISYIDTGRCYQYPPHISACFALFPPIHSSPPPPPCPFLHPYICHWLTSFRLWALAANLEHCHLLKHHSQNGFLQHVAWADILQVRNHFLLSLYLPCT